MRATPQGRRILKGGRAASGRGAGARPRRWRTSCAALDDSRAASYHFALCNGMKGRQCQGVNLPPGGRPATGSHADGAPQIRYREPAGRRSRPPGFRTQVNDA
jgi:hypothetical protein